MAIDLHAVEQGGLGDNDLTANGTVTGPGGPGVAAAVPSMPVVGVVGLGLLLTLLAWRRQATAGP